MSTLDRDRVLQQNKRWRAISYDWDILSAYGQSRRLYCLSDFQVAWLLSTAPYMGWKSRWENCPCTPEELANMTAELEADLMMCCDFNPPDIGFVKGQINQQTLQEYQDRFDSGGIPELNPNTPTTFYSGTGSIEEVNALCMAVDTYIRSYLDSWRQTALATLALGGIALIFTAVNPLLGLIAGLVVTGLSFITKTATDAATDETAIQQLVCCMNTALDGADVTEANFQTSLDACGFTTGSNASIIRDIVASDLDKQGNWLSFLNALGDATVLTQANVVFDCPCANNWAWTSDFNTDQNIWVPIALNPPFDTDRAVWNVGTGWNFVDSQLDTAVFRRNCSIVATFPSTQIDSFQMVWDLTNGTYNPAITQLAVQFVLGGVVQSSQSFASGSISNGNDKVFNFGGTLPVTADEIRVFNACSNNNVASFSGNVKIDEFTITGFGTNPFAP